MRTLPTLGALLSVLGALLSALGALLSALGAGPAAALEALQPGMKAPDFSLTTFEGAPMKLSALGRSSGILLVFWSSWSEKSPELLARVEAVHARLAAKGLSVIGVNVEGVNTAPEDLKAARALAQRLRLTFPLAVDHGLTVFSAYGVVAVPTSVVMRGDTTIVADLAAYPIAGREDFFDAVEATVLGPAAVRRPPPPVNQPNPRAVRYFNLARAMVARGLVDQVDGNLKKAIELDATFILPRVLLGQIYRERAVTFESVQAGTRSAHTLRLSPEERETYLREAERLLESALRLDPSNPAALVELAAIRVAGKDAGAARELLRRALATNSDFAPARAQLGAVLMRGDDVSGGRREIDAALKLNPLDWRLYLTAGQAHEERGMTAEATTYYRKGVELLWHARRELFPLSYGR